MRTSLIASRWEARLATALGVFLNYFQWCAQAYAQPEESPTLNAPKPIASDGPQSSVPIQWEVPVHSRTRSQSPATIAASTLDEELARWNIGGNSDSNHISNRNGYHPGTRVIVDFDVNPPKVTKSLASRYLSDFRSYGYWPFRLCFETALNQPPRKTVDAQLRVTIGSKGRIASVRFLRSSTSEGLLNDCLRQATRQLTVRPMSPRFVTGVLRVRISPGDSPLNAYVSRNPPSNSAQFSTAENATQVREDVESCVRAASYRDPRLWGLMELQIILARDGHPVSVSEHNSHFPDRNALSCAVDAMLRLKFSNLNAPAVSMAAFRLGQLP